MIWNPIETAPKNKKVLVFIPASGEVRIAWYCEETGLWPEDWAFSEEGEPCNVGLPSHWMWKPSPPASEINKKGKRWQHA